MTPALDEEREEVLRVLASLKQGLLRAAPVTLSRDYMSQLQRVEASKENRPGADKSWVEPLLIEAEQHFAAAVRVR